MDSDGDCTVVACSDGSVRVLASLEDGGFVQVRNRTTPSPPPQHPNPKLRPVLSRGAVGFRSGTFLTKGFDFLCPDTRPQLKKEVRPLIYVLQVHL